jgi:hypothetical protein
MSCTTDAGCTYWLQIVLILLVDKALSSMKNSYLEEHFKLCKILGVHGGDYGEWRLLGCSANVVLVRTDDSEELSASIIRVTGIGG